MKTNQKKIEYALEVSPEELYGHIRATQVAIVNLASHFGCLEELKCDVAYFSARSWENGFLPSDPESGREAITRHELPELFQGVRDACDHMVNMIELRERLNDPISE